MAFAFATAGLINTSQLEDLNSELAELNAVDIQTLVDWIMVPGRFGLSVPLELVARAWGKSDYGILAHILRGLDILRTREDNNGHLSVGPRHTLEAELIVQTRIASADAEIEIVKKLLQAIRQRSIDGEDGEEVNFAIALVRATGAQGTEEIRFGRKFREVAAALKDIRETRNVNSPRLMLQEANLLREWVQSESRREQVETDEASEVLREANQVLHEALNQVNDRPRSRSMRGVLETERASGLGTEVINLINGGAPKNNVVRAFKNLQDAIGTARKTDPFGYPPVDVLAWTTTSMFRANLLDDQEQAEAFADITDVFESIDAENLDS